MRPLSEWLELMLAEIAQREEQARSAAEEAARRSSGDPPRPSNVPGAQSDAAPPDAAHSGGAPTAPRPRRKSGQASTA